MSAGGLVQPSVHRGQAAAATSKATLLTDASLYSAYCFIRNFIGASAGSTVAIDNKIEQAMDLVKSHLMFAVREEVDVLKERITELLDRISQLEYENGILRASATPETLSRLNQQPQQPLAAPPPPQQQQQQQQQAPPSTQQQAQPPQPQTTNRSS